MLATTLSLLLFSINCFRFSGFDYVTGGGYHLDSTGDDIFVFAGYNRDIHIYKRTDVSYSIHQTITIPSGLQSFSVLKTPPYRLAINYWSSNTIFY